MIEITAIPEPDARTEFRSARRRLQAQWQRGLADRQTLEEVWVRPVEAAAPAAGSQPQVVVEDERGRH